MMMELKAIFLFILLPPGYVSETDGSLGLL
jgi:hypothetical protein